MKKPKIVISARQAVEDLRSGMDDEGLMAKYNLTYRQLQRLFRKMIELEYITPMEVAQRLCVTKSQVVEAFQDAKNAIKELD